MPMPGVPSSGLPENYGQPAYGGIYL